MSGPPAPPPVIEGTREITYQEITANKQLEILDVRTREEQEETGVIPGAKLFSFKQMDSDLSLDDASFMSKYGFAKPSLDAPLVTHCGKGGRARRAYNLLHEKGFTNHRLYAGSFQDWVKNGGDVVKPEYPKQ
ncbi:unnamed protein product [Meganyctiphanes norvegica]|uniref:Rhodanese domain-containing protein n=1 Tax=Meganyctiphanes norvegica TaxID=48144 RepID=A0AAV2R9H9_MEGNR